jgi:hemoglobin
MNRLRIVLVVALGSLVVACASPAPPTAPSSGTPLFDALGGKPGIALLMDDFVPRLSADPRIGSFFKRTDLADLKKQLADQFCVVAGGPCAYQGATMKKSHADLNITKADFNRLVELLQLSMDARGIGFADQNRLLARLAPMHRDIVDAN